MPNCRLRLRKILEELRDQIRRQSPQHTRGGFTSIYDLVLKMGVEYRHGDLPPSCLAFPPKRCFQNAAAVSRIHDWTYVEGFVWSETLVIPIHHAWCSAVSGVAIDPTLVDNIGERTYLGIPFTREAVVRFGGNFTLLDDWKSDWPIPNMSTEELMEWIDRK